MSIHTRLFARQLLIDIAPEIVPEETVDRALEIAKSFETEVSEHVLNEYEAEEVAKSALYLASQEQEVAIRLHELRDTGRLGTVIRRVREATDIHTLPPNSEQYVERFGLEMEFSDKVIEKANEIAELKETPHQPATEAAAALYLAAQLTNNSKSQFHISISTGVSEQSIRKAHSKYLDAYLEQSGN